MVATALILLITKIPTVWFATSVSIIICREIFVSALREWIAQQQHSTSTNTDNNNTNTATATTCTAASTTSGNKGGSIIKVRLLGKIKTSLQMISITLLLLTFPHIGVIYPIQSSNQAMYRASVFLFGLFTFMTSVLFTIISGIQYFRAAWPFLVDAEK